VLRLSKYLIVNHGRYSRQVAWSAVGGVLEPASVLSAACGGATVLVSAVADQHQAGSPFLQQLDVSLRRQLIEADPAGGPPRMLKYSNATRSGGWMALSNVAGQHLRRP
jgi:hypothetical protein